MKICMQILLVSALVILVTNRFHVGKNACVLALSLHLNRFDLVTRGHLAVLLELWYLWRHADIALAKEQFGDGGKKIGIHSP